MLRAYHGILRWLSLSTFQSYKIYPSLPSFLCLWTLIAVKRYRMEPYSILQASDITATPNNTSVRRICDQNRSNLPNVTNEWCEIVRNTVLGSQSDVTVVAKPLIFETWARAAILVQFSVLQRSIKIQGFDQIQKFFSRNSHQSMTIFLGRKNNLGVRCTLSIGVICSVFGVNESKRAAELQIEVFEGGFVATQIVANYNNQV